VKGEGQDRVAQAVEWGGPGVAAGSHGGVEGYTFGEPPDDQQELVGVWVEENAILGVQADEQSQ